MIGVEARVFALCSSLVLGSLACGDDLPIAPEQGMSSSGGSSTTTSGSSGEPGSSSSSAAPASSDEGVGTTTTSGGPSSVGIPDECTVTADCLDGELCVAPFDQTAGAEGKGAYECVPECVVIMDEDRWCADADACCDPEAECTDRGYCVYPDGSTGGSEGSSGSTGGGPTG
jgi:hypothetical protein